MVPARVGAGTHRSSSGHGSRGAVPQDLETADVDVHDEDHLLDGHVALRLGEVPLHGVDHLGLRVEDLAVGRVARLVNFGHHTLFEHSPGEGPRRREGEVPHAHGDEHVVNPPQQLRRETFGGVCGGVGHA